DVHLGQLVQAGEGVLDEQRLLRLAALERAKEAGLSDARHHVPRLLLEADLGELAAEGVAGDGDANAVGAQIHALHGELAAPPARRPVEDRDELALDEAAHPLLDGAQAVAEIAEAP